MSNQIATDGFEMSGGSNVGLMMNGAPTNSWRDDVTIETAEATDEESPFLFGSGP